MAFITKLILASALASLVSAAPVNIQRDAAVVTEIAYKTVDVPVIVWVDEDGKPIKTEVPDINVAAETPSDLKSSALPSSTSTSFSVSIPTTPTVIAAAYVPTTSAIAPIITTTPVETPQVTYQPSPSQWQPSVSALPTTPPSSNPPSGQSGVCQGAGSGCSGDITHYDGGLGACGWDVNTASDMQIALPVGLMGSQSNGNPYCGKSLTIKNPTTGATVQATVGDKCMGCTGYSIDLTNALFAAIGNGCDGRCSGFEWWFN